MKSVASAPRSTAAYRWSVASRVAAAAAGGYVLTGAFSLFLSLFLSLVLSMHRDPAQLTASMLSFAVYVAAIIWVFSLSSAWRAWLAMLLPSLLLAGLSALLIYTRGN